MCIAPVSALTHDEDWWYWWECNQRWWSVGWFWWQQKWYWLYKADGEDIHYWTGDRNGSDVENVGNEGSRWSSFNNISVLRQFREQLIQATLQDIIFI